MSIAVSPYWFSGEYPPPVGPFPRTTRYGVSVNVPSPAGREGGGEYAVGAASGVRRRNNPPASVRDTYPPRSPTPQSRVRHHLLDLPTAIMMTPQGGVRGAGAPGGNPTGHLKGFYPIFYVPSHVSERKPQPARRAGASPPAKPA